MKAGRELDALVAEKVMGLTSLVATGTLRDGLGPFVINPNLPRYSTDIAAAWEVAQRVRDIDDDNQFIVHLSLSEHRECEVEVKFWTKEGSDWVLAGPLFILGETAPHAICLAALRARGVEL